MNLFQSGQFKLHSGGESSLKIDCNALTDEDWATVARVVAQQIPFRYAIGVPTGGLKFAEALNKYRNDEAMLDTYEPYYVGLPAEQALKAGKTVQELKKEFITKAQALGVTFADKEVDLHYGEVSSE